MEDRIIIIKAMYFMVLTSFGGFFDHVDGNPKGKCENTQCPEPVDCPPDSYRHPVILQSNRETCCPLIQDCLCNPGLICPPPLSCPLGWVASIATPVTGRPGQCCPHYECIRIAAPTDEEIKNGQPCIFNGNSYHTGRVWLNREDCSECVCHHGVISCNPVECDVHPECAVVKTIRGSGSCCPVCAGCMTTSGTLRNNTDVWQEDPCTTCECSEGRIKCQAVMCVRTTCLNPIRSPGECCPRCQGNESSECPHKECGELECPNGFRLGSTGCPVCECISCPRLVECSIQECEFGFETNEEGCPICSCRMKEEQDVHVHHQSQEPGTVVPVSSSACMILSSGISHQNGEEWVDKCRRCICKDGLEMCSLISCFPAKCEHPVLFPGSCCPRCPEEFLEQQDSEGDVLSGCKESPSGIDVKYSSGDLWKLGTCLTCTCHNGLVLCSTPDCPPTPCPQDEIAMDKEDDCCLRCRTDLKHRILSDKNSFTNSTKQNCFSDDSQRVYVDGEAWKVGDCESCICEEGQIHCFSHWKCPPIQCERPILAKNQCCPICLDGNGRMTTTGHGPKEYLITSQEDTNLEKTSFSLGVEANCVVIISVLLCVLFLLIVYIIRTYFHHRQCRLAKEIPFNCSNSSATLRDSTPECCYDYTKCRQLCEQKTPLHQNDGSRDFSLMLHTDRL